MPNAASEWTVVDLPPRPKAKPNEWEVVEPPRAAPSKLRGFLTSIKDVIGMDVSDEERDNDERARAQILQEATGSESSASTRAVLTGATFGVFPRIEAAANALFGDASYDENLEEIRKQQLAWAEKNPGTALANEILGGMVLPVAAGVRLGQQAGGVVRLATGSRAAQGAAHVAVPGAIVGGGAGVGYSEDWTDPGQVAQDAAVGAGAGAALGPAFAWGGNALWAGGKAAGRGIRDISGRIGEWFGADATPAATRILASVAEGGDIARLPGVTRADGRRTADDLQNAVNNARVEGVDDSLVAADRRIARLNENLAGQSWMPDQPYDDFARRALDGQQERVSQGVADTLRGAPGTNHTANMLALEHQRAAAFDPRYDQVRAGVLAGQPPGNMQVTGLYQIADESPEVFNRYFQEALGDVVADQRVRFSADDARNIFGQTHADRQLTEALDAARAAKADADYIVAQARADLSDAQLQGGNVQAARDALDVARNGSLHADVALRDAQIAAAGVQHQPRLITTNMHPAVAERFYHRLSDAANGGDQQALRLLEQYKDALRGTAKGRDLMELKEDHAAAFSRLDAAQKGERLWGTTGARRSEAMRDMERMDPSNQAVFGEAAAGSAGQRVAGDTGTFSRPQNIVGSAENRGTMDEVFGEDSRRAAYDLVGREGHLHDVVGRLTRARQQGGDVNPDGFVANALRMGVQWQFTPSVAMMNAYQRAMTGITRQRGAAIAQLSTSPEGVARVLAQMRAWEAARARVQPRAATLSALSQLGTTDGRPAE